MKLCLGNTLGGSARALVLWWLACAPALAQVRFEPGDRAASTAGEGSVLLLRNGQVLRGRITRAGDRYLVGVGASGELSVPAGEAQWFGDSLDGAYLAQRDALPASAHQHVRLGLWCLRHGLVARAADQWLAAHVLTPNHPALPGLEEQLHHAAAPAAESAPGADTESTRPADATSEGAADALRTVPAAAVERFAQTIQPLILNRCGANRCHGDGEQGAFSLTRSPTGQNLPRRWTDRNLRAVLAQVNRRDPQQSPLLVKAATAHGGETSPPLSPRDQGQFTRLVEWVESLAEAEDRRGEDGREEKVGGPAARLSNTTSAPGATRDGGQAALPQRVAPHVVSPHGVLPQPGARPKTLTEPAPRDAAATTSEDPLDPEVFNRRFAPPE